MSKHYQFYSRLTVLVVLSIFSHSLFGQNDFAFELTKPTTNELTVNEFDKVSVNITFDAEAVNETGAYIAIMVDGTIVRFMAATTMESPFTNTISAETLGKGEHTVEYLLLPSGSQDPTEALAKVSLQLTIEGSSFKTDVDIESFVQDIVETIQNSDVSAFKSHCITREGMDNILQSIAGDTPKEAGIKTELSAMDPEKETIRVIAKFNGLQKAFSEKDADISVVKLQKILKQDTMLEMAEFSAKRIKCVIGSGNTTFTIKIDTFITKEKAYIFDFGFEPGL